MFRRSRRLTPQHLRQRALRQRRQRQMRLESLEDRRMMAVMFDGFDYLPQPLPTTPVSLNGQTGGSGWALGSSWVVVQPATTTIINENLGGPAVSPAVRLDFTNQSPSAVRGLPGR